VTNLESGALAGLMARACRFCGSPTKAIDVDGNVMDSTKEVRVCAGTFHHLPEGANVCRCGQLVARASAEA
jgi:hypothetical protein